MALRWETITLSVVKDVKYRRLNITEIMCSGKNTLCAPVRTQTHVFSRDYTAEVIFASSNFPCNDPDSYRILRSKQAAGANRCCDIAIGLH